MIVCILVTGYPISRRETCCQGARRRKEDAQGRALTITACMEVMARPAILRSFVKPSNFGGIFFPIDFDVLENESGLVAILDQRREMKDFKPAALEVDHLWVPVSITMQEMSMTLAALPEETLSLTEAIVIHRIREYFYDYVLVVAPSQLDSS